MKALTLLLIPLGAVTLAAAPPTGVSVTFAKDIAPIFQEKCERCHRPGQGTPMSLRSYAEVRPWAKSIRERVAAKIMPPWHLDPTIGIQKYANDASLTAAQIATIVSWVDAGAPPGDSKDLPAPKVWPEDGGWQYAKIVGREPDFVVKSTDWTVPARGQDEWWQPVSDVPLTEERWVQAIEMKPGTAAGRKVTHHAVVQLEQFDPQNSGPPAPLADWAIGKTWDAFRPGTGKLIRPGAKLRWDIHYHSAGEQITDHMELAVYLYPKGTAPDHPTQLSFLAAYNDKNDLDIPPNTVTSTRAIHLLNTAARLENFQAHMHLRGKAMAMEAILPDGTIEVLSYVNRYNFNWVNNYIYADDSAPVVPKGTAIRITAWYDNTDHNKDNPDPNEWVGFGERQVEEMGHAWVNITPLSDKEYSDWLASHKGNQTKGKLDLPPLQPPQESGQSITPSYEGWWQNADGTYNLLFGYFNRNTKQILDIPLGQSNHFDGPKPDLGQPTHFLTRRQKGVFTVTVPKDFGDKKLTWTLTANGKTLSVPGHLGPQWMVSPMKDISVGNTPPTISFDEPGGYIQGPKPLIAERTVRAGEPLNLTVFAADDNRSLRTKVFRLRLESAAAWMKANNQSPRFTDAVAAAKTDPDPSVATPLFAAAAAAGADASTLALYMGSDVSLDWQKYRGPGDVLFTAPRVQVQAVDGSTVPIRDAFNGRGDTTATFSQPGEYTLRVVVRDSSGIDGGDFVCCWTNGEVNVKVQ